MTKGYSKVLVNEMMIPNKGALWLTMAMDWMMMVLLSSRERMGVSLEDTIALCWAQSRQDLDGSLRCARLD